MPLSRLESLPPEVSQEIAELLVVDYQEISLDIINKQHLRSFATASKACYDAAVPVALRRISIAAEKKDRQQLRKIIDSWLVTLRRNDNSRNVRRITVDGTLYGTRGSGFYGNGLDDDAWSLVGEILQLTPQLAEFYYKSRNQISAGLLHALAKFTPRCKLHIQCLELPPAPENEITEPGLVALATSPNLHSIRVNVELVTNVVGSPERRYTHARDLVLRMLEGSAPNIKHISVHHLEKDVGVPLQSMMFDLVFGTTYRNSEKYKNIVRRIPAGVSKSLPTTFTFFGSPMLDLWLLKTLGQQMDFSALHSFRWYPHWGIGVQDLNWAAVSANFKSLSKLEIRLARGGRTVGMDSAASLFMASLPPLKELVIDRYASQEILDSIAVHHGPSLEKLWLETDRWVIYPWNVEDGMELVSRVALTTDMVKRFVARCPLLEDLHLPIRRSGSDADEVAIYQSLGGLKRLRRLRLTLDWADHWDFLVHENQPVNVNQYEGYDAEPILFVWEPEGRILNGHIKDALKNAAMDAPLAASIWNTIREQHGVLERLELHMESMDHIFNTRLRQIEFMYMIASLSRSFKIESSRDAADPRPKLTHLSSYNQSELEKSLQCHGNTKIGHKPLHYVSAFHIFRKLWPSKQGSSGWRQDWSSVPLHGQANEQALDDTFNQCEKGDSCFRSALQQLLYDRAKRLPTEGIVERIPAV